MAEIREKSQEEKVASLPLFLLKTVTAASAQSRERRFPMNIAPVAGAESGAKTVLARTPVAHSSSAVVSESRAQALQQARAN